MGSHRLAFASRRLIQLVPVVLAIASFNFVLIHLAPGDAADVIAGQGGYSTPEYVAELRREFGLDKPLYQQYFIYIGRVLTLDLGFSPVQQKPVMTLILERCSGSSRRRDADRSPIPWSPSVRSSSTQLRHSGSASC